MKIHDPSTLIKEGDTFWVFGTGPGIVAYSSTDLRRWHARGRVFGTVPEWVSKAVPRLKGDFLWAPDVRLVRGRYLLYYAASSFGRNVSAIGLAVTKSLDSARWDDGGPVVRSGAGDDFNAIDPAVTETPAGDLYLSFGSFWSGIKLARLDSASGKRTDPAAPLTALAAHPQDRANSIEAPFVYAHEGWFYLFVNWDYCCRGARSTYNIRIGRSRRIEGPYRDKAGVPLLKGGGTSFLDSAPERGLVGPGHAGILCDAGQFLFSCHYEYSRDNDGRATLAVARLTWDHGGWPTLHEL